jgi:hypothetical protein
MNVDHGEVNLREWMIMTCYLYLSNVN